MCFVPIFGCCCYNFRSVMVDSQFHWQNVYEHIWPFSTQRMCVGELCVRMLGIIISGPRCQPTEVQFSSINKQSDPLSTHKSRKQSVAEIRKWYWWHWWRYWRLLGIINIRLRANGGRTVMDSYRRQNTVNSHCTLYRIMKSFTVRLLPEQPTDLLNLLQLPSQQLAVI